MADGVASVFQGLSRILKCEIVQGAPLNTRVDRAQTAKRGDEEIKRANFMAFSSMCTGNLCVCFVERSFITDSNDKVEH